MNICNHCWHPDHNEIDKHLGFAMRRCCKCMAVEQVSERQVAICDYEDLAVSGPFGDYDA